jgi:hypothetical protein
MKFCQVVLIMTLGLAAEPVLEAQTQAAAPVLVASEAMPDGLFFPDLLAGSGHDSLLQGLAMTPEISQAIPKPPEAPLPVHQLTKMDRLTLFWNDTYASPGAFVGLSAGAFVDQVRHTPAKWDGDGSGYTRRFASEYGQLATRNVIHEGLAGVAGLDPRYSVCNCAGTMERSYSTCRRSPAPTVRASSRPTGIRTICTVPWCREFSLAMNKWAKC